MPVGVQQGLRSTRLLGAFCFQTKIDIFHCSIMLRPPAVEACLILDMRLDNPDMSAKARDNCLGQGWNSYHLLQRRSEVIDKVEY